LKLDFNSNFIFTVCQVGAEPVLKEEVARNYPQLKFAYSRPGFVTFKNLSPEVDLRFQSVFARAHGYSLGPSQIDRILDIALQLKVQCQGDQPLRLHVWEREFFPPGEEPLGFVPGVLAAEWEKEIWKSGSSFFAEGRDAKPGDWVLDLIVLEKQEGWVGFHRHSGAHSPWPGGRIPVVLPEEAPSRAYLKLEEALISLKVPVEAADIAVEVGSAPGGASYALLKRGLRVVGVDPAEMDPVVLNHPQFSHIQKSVHGLTRKELPPQIQWLLLDMNVQPQISLAAIERMLHPAIDSLLGVILTVKLNEWRLASQIPEFVERVRTMGTIGSLNPIKMTRVKAVQLPSHRQEILIFGLTRKGAVRNK